jgi:hypothetical protein
MSISGTFVTNVPLMDIFTRHYVESKAQVSYFPFRCVGRFSYILIALPISAIIYFVLRRLFLVKNVSSQVSGNSTLLAEYLSINTSFILTQTIEKKKQTKKNKQKSPCWWLLSKHF